MSQLHHYQVWVNWKSDTGTTGYKDYSRDHIISVSDKPDIAASSDPSFRGNPANHNPEELFLASVANCHMLWYLHLCAVNGIVVTSYQDKAKGIMQENEDGSGHFKEIILYPVVTVLSQKMAEKAVALHTEANKLCFIANSLNFAVSHQPQIVCDPE